MAIVMKRLILPVALLAVGVAVWAQQPFPQGPPQGVPPQGFPPQQAQPPQGQQQDDPADAAEHGVARLSLVNGSITVTRGDSGETVGSTVNAPLVTTDRITTGDGSRAEIQFDPASMIRLGANTDVRMGDLQYRHYLVQISQGTTLFRVLSDTGAQIEISTPSVSVTPLRQGIYRVTVRPDGSSEITVRAGEAELSSPSGTERLPAGQTMFSRGSANDPEFMSAAAIPFDEWDRWNADRDRSFERAPDVSRYAPPDMAGTAELSNYGRWVWDPNYGYVWVPNNEPPDWAPYRDGRWDDLDYYGWSWVSYDPWGWAPYHYGNWYRASFGWAWYPGALSPRHFWRPAMVGFFGFGSPAFGVSLGFGYGNVGWVPLAPFEHFRPWYGRGYAGRNGIVVNNTNIAATYRNARVSGAVTGLRAADFGRVGVNRSAFVRPESGDLARAGMVSGGTPFAPARSLRANNNVVRLGGATPNTGASNSGWRRLDTRPSAPSVGGNRSEVHIFSSSSQREAPQAVRISPSIVNNRSASGSPGGFGGPRPNSFGAPPTQQAAPAYTAPRGNTGFYRAPQGNGGGGYRSAPPSGGGGNRGGGGSHGGGGHSGGHGR